jgi:hypothetical protein
MSALDRARTEAVVAQSASVLKKAAQRGNRLCLAVLGNIAPGATGSSADSIASFKSVVSMAESGMDNSHGFRVSADDVSLLIGRRELLMLRLLPGGGEVVRASSPVAQTVLRATAPLEDPDSRSYNDSLKALPATLSEDQLAVAMMIKLDACAKYTMQSPKLVEDFARHLATDAFRDRVAYNALIGYLETTASHSVEEGVARLLHEDVLTPEGLGLLPAAVETVDAVLHFVETDLLTFARTSKLMHCLQNTGQEGSTGGLWLGAMSAGAVDSNLLKQHAIRGDARIALAELANSNIHSLVRKMQSGPVDAKALQAFTDSRAVPFVELEPTLDRPVYGVTAHGEKAFGIMQRKVVFDPTRISRTEAGVCGMPLVWAELGTRPDFPSAFWALATWCGSTRADMDAAPPVANRSLGLKKLLLDVSLTLASLLTVDIGGRKLNSLGVDSLKGTVGPVVSSASGTAKQPMRLVSFSHPSLHRVFVVFLPEPFVRHALSSFNMSSEIYRQYNDPFVALEGFLALPAETAVPIAFEGATLAEEDHVRAELGNRVFSLTRSQASGGVTVEAMRAWPAGCTDDLLTCILFRTHQSASDGLAGLPVKLKNVPGTLARMTVVPDVASL